MKKLLFIPLLFSSMIYSQTHTQEKNSFGIELNPVRLIINSNDYISLSGGFSYFNKENGTEIAIPWVYTKENIEEFNANSFSKDERLLTIDIQYRQYQEKKIEGFFYGGFTRYAYLTGNARDRNAYAKQHKFGLGGVVGIKQLSIIKNTPIYWGMSLSIGGYLNSENEIFQHELLTFDTDDRRFFFDIELLKIGIEF